MCIFYFDVVKNHERVTKELSRQKACYTYTNLTGTTVSLDNILRF